MLKINIEGDEPTVYAVLAVLGAHAAASLTGVTPVIPQVHTHAPTSGVGSSLWLKGREIAGGVVEDWRIGWDLPADEQPDRAEILPPLSKLPGAMSALLLYLTTTDDPWVAVGANAEQAAHIAQVGSALQLLPAPDPVIPAT